MKAYMKPAIAEVELFTKDAISLTVPKTVYRRAAAGGSFVADDQVIAHALAAGEALSGLAEAGVEF